MLKGLFRSLNPKYIFRSFFVNMAFWPLIILNVANILLYLRISSGQLVSFFSTAICSATSVCTLRVKVLSLVGSDGEVIK